MTEITLAASTIGALRQRLPNTAARLHSLPDGPIDELAQTLFIFLFIVGIRRDVLRALYEINAFIGRTASLVKLLAVLARNECIRRAVNEQSGDIRFLRKRNDTRVKIRVAAFKPNTQSKRHHAQSFR